MKGISRVRKAILRGLDVWTPTTTSESRSSGAVMGSEDLQAEEVDYFFNK